jgi:hypothetical protein
MFSVSVLKSVDEKGGFSGEIPCENERCQLPPSKFPENAVTV